MVLLVELLNPPKRLEDVELLPDPSCNPLKIDVDPLDSVLVPVPDELAPPKIDLPVAGEPPKMDCDVVVAGVLPKEKEVMFCTGFD